MRSAYLTGGAKANLATAGSPIKTGRGNDAGAKKGQGFTSQFFLAG